MHDRSNWGALCEIRSGRLGERVDGESLPSLASCLLVALSERVKLLLVLVVFDTVLLEPLEMVKPAGVVYEGDSSSGG